jgi:DNA-binding response OmpR family regulator
MQDGKHLILVIDDDAEIRDSLEIILAANDYAVATAATASEGLQVYRQRAPDLLIIDLMMEEIDSGTNLARELKAMGNSAPVYMLSSTGDSLTHAVDYHELGLDGVFQKPVKPDALLSVLAAKLA